MTDEITLQPLAMIIPNRYHIYQPSILQPLKIISEFEFISKYADYPRSIRVCQINTFDLDEMLDQSNLMTAYSYGADCWYIIAN